MDFELWSYPHVDTLASHDNSEVTVKDMPAHTPPAEIAPLPEPEPIHEQLLQEHLALMEKLTEHINLLANVGQTITDQMHHVNTTLLPNMTQLVRKVTEAVILKEISIDNDRLKQMVEQALPQLQSSNESCTVYIATEHYDYFTSQVTLPAEVIFKPDSSLKAGDFRIKNALCELESILEHRLNEIFGL